MKKLLIFGWLVLLTGCGITTKLPPIPGHHWHRDTTGATLYTDDGREAAIFLAAIDGPADICIFEQTAPCGRFETNDEAMEWVKQQYSAGDSK